jgi:hypothetical protein
METPHLTPPADFGNSANRSFRESFSDSVHFWELRRIPYNIVLAAVVVVWVSATWPHFRPAFTWSSLLLLSILAFIANACYCAAYLVDIPMLRSSVSSVWKHWRWGLWLLGMLFATVLANYWIVDEIYPFVR